MQHAIAVPDPRAAKPPTDAKSSNLSVEDIRNVVRGASLLGGGCGNTQAAMAIVDQLMTSISYPCIAPQDLPPDAKIMCVGRVGWAAPGLVWTVQSLAALYYQYVNFIGSTGEKWYILPIDLSPENLAIAFGLIFAAGYQVIGVVDCDGAGTGVAALDMLALQDLQTTMTPFCLNGGVDGGKTYTAQYLTGDVSASTADSLARSFVSQIPQSFQPQAGLAAGWGTTADQLYPLSSQGSVTFCLLIGESISSGEYTGQGICEKLTALGRTATVLTEGLVINTSAKVDKGLYKGRTQIFDRFRSATITVYFENCNLTAWDNTSYYPIAHAPSSICWFDEDQKVGLTNADLTMNTSIFVSAIVVAPVRGYTASGRAMTGTARALKRAGYAGRVVTPSLSGGAVGRAQYHATNMDLTKTPDQY